VNLFTREIILFLLQIICLTQKRNPIKKLSTAAADIFLVVVVVDKPRMHLPSSEKKTPLIRLH
jgi:hypothetical protein